MPENRKKWSFRRWRRRWNDRFASWALRWRIWFDRHVLSHETRRRWRQRWARRSRKIGSAVENVGYKVLPTRPDAAPNSMWTRWLDRIDRATESLLPAKTRVRYARAVGDWWHEFTSPFRRGNFRVRRWLGNYLMPNLTPAGFRKNFFNWRGTAIAVGLIGLACLSVFWAIPQWREHNDSKWAAQARLLLNRGYQSMAYQGAVRVLQHDEDNEDAARIIADLLERQGVADAVAWRRKVLQRANSITNQLSLAATALRFEPPPSPTARRMLDGITGDATNLVQYRIVAAQWEAKRGNLGGAEEHYFAAARTEPTNAEITLALALVQLQSREATKVELAESTLVSLANQTNLTARALRPLVVAACSRGDFATAIEHSKRVMAEEASTFEDRLTHLEVLTRKRDPNTERFLATLQEHISANPLYVAKLAGWMTARGQTREALSWFRRLPPAIQRSDLVLIATADVYAAEADWQGLEKFLQHQPGAGLEPRGWGTIEFVRQALLARAYREQGERRAFMDSFARVKDLAEGMSVRLTSLTRLVGSWGWEAEVEELLWTMFERYPAETWAADALLKKYRDRNDTDAIGRVFALQLKRSPNDALLKNNLAMILLLLDQDLATAHKLALESHLANPQSAVNTSTYAFSLLKQGRAAEGKAAMESLGQELLKVPSIAAYYAVIANAAGDSATARHYLDLARRADLLPEEKSLLESIH